MTAAEGLLELGTSRAGDCDRPRPSMWTAFKDSSAVVVNLMVAAAGAGLLSFPWALRKQGVLLGSLLTVLAAVLMWGTDMILVHFARVYHNAGRLRMCTYDELAEQVLGYRGFVAAVISVIVGSLGALTGFLIILADLCTHVMKRAVSDSSHLSFLGSRAGVIILFAVAVALPLSWCRSLHSLRGSSAFAIATVVMVAGVVAGRSFSTIRDRSEAFALETGPVVLVGSSWDPFFGLPVVIFSLGNHLQVVPLFTEPATLSSASRHSHAIVACAVFGCVAIYLMTGVFGYLHFRKQTDGDILSNYSTTSGSRGERVLTDVVKLVMGLHVALAYPVVMFPLRRSIELLWSRHKGQGQLSPSATASVPVNASADATSAANSRSLSPLVRASGSDHPTQRAAHVQEPPHPDRRPLASHVGAAGYQSLASMHGTHCDADGCGSFGHPTGSHCSSASAGGGRGIGGNGDANTADGTTAFDGLDDDVALEGTYSDAIVLMEPSQAQPVMLPPGIVFALNVSVVIATAALAILIPQVSTVFGLMGASVSVAQVLVIPGWMLVKRADVGVSMLPAWADLRVAQVVGVATIVIGVVVGAIGTAVTIAGL